jgi:hypothetical protein
VLALPLPHQTLRELRVATVVPQERLRLFLTVVVVMVAVNMLIPLVDTKDLFASFTPAPLALIHQQTLETCKNEHSTIY